MGGALDAEWALRRWLVKNGRCGAPGPGRRFCTRDAGTDHSRDHSDGRGTSWSWLDVLPDYPPDREVVRYCGLVGEPAVFHGGPADEMGGQIPVPAPPVMLFQWRCPTHGAVVVEYERALAEGHWSRDDVGQVVYAYQGNGGCRCSTSD